MKEDSSLRSVVHAKPSEERLPRELRMFVAVLVLAALLEAAQLLVRPQLALAYSCGTATSGNHCVAGNEWPGAVNGSSTNISIVSLSCYPSSCYNSSTSQESGFVDNEMWLYDFGSSTCAAICWVESGYTTETGDFLTGGEIITQTAYFWADLRPQDHGTNEHPLNVVPSGDYGRSVEFHIAKCCGSNTYEPLIFSPTLGTLTEYSTNNAMQANRIEIGQELAGSGGASAATADFTYNTWISTRDNTTHYQYLNGSVDLEGAPPPAGYWVVYPNKSSTGGDWQTSCCS